MDEIETRLAAVELFLIEVASFLDPAALADAHRSIAGGLEGATAEERTIRMGALGLIEDAQRRWAPPGEGIHIPGGGT